MINIQEMKCIKTIYGHISQVNYLLLLKDNRIASCSNDKTIRIFNPSNDYHCDQVLKRHSDDIISICQLDDGTIVSCSKDKSIIIGDYTIKNAHILMICKVITLPNNRIASCSWDNTIKIWKSEPPYSDKPIKVLEGHFGYIWSILYIQDRDIMISGSNDFTLSLWNILTYQCVTVIEEINCVSTNSLYQIDNNRVIVGERETFSIVNIDKCVIEKTTKDESFGIVNCSLKLRDNKTILVGCDYGTFFYDMRTKQYEVKDIIEYPISNLLLINDKTFLSCSCSINIKVWDY